MPHVSEASLSLASRRERIASRHGRTLEQAKLQLSQIEARIANACAKPEAMLSSPARALDSAGRQELEELAVLARERVSEAEDRCLALKRAMLELRHVLRAQEASGRDVVP